MSIKIHPLADVQTTKIGDLSSIWQFCVILEGAVIGANVNINCNCFVENDVIIGDNVTIKSGVQVWDGLRIENNVFVGPNVTFTNNPKPRSKQFIEKHDETIIKENASIGANSTIIVGVTIGTSAMIGAGSVVTKDVPPYTLWYGNPARHKGYVTKEGITLDLSLYDKINQQQYKLVGDNPIIL